MSTVAVPHAGQPSLEAAAARYRLTAVAGLLATAVCTLANPITGAAVGTFFITNISVGIGMEMLGYDPQSLVARVAKAALSVILAGATSVAVLSALGVAITFSSALTGCFFALLAMNVLLVFATTRTQP